MIKVDNNIIKIVISDIDGTILPSSGKLSKKTIKGLKHFIDEGIYFVFNSGNMPNISKWIVEKITPKITDKTRYFIGNSGIVTHDFLLDETYMQGSFNNKQVKDIVKLLKKEGIHFHLVDKDLKNYYFSNKIDADIEKKKLKKRKVKVNIFLLNDDILNEIESPKIVYKTKDAFQYSEIILKLNSVLGNRIFTPMSWEKNSVDLITYGHDKYSGILSIIKQINETHNEDIKLNNILYFGDSYNDISVFKNLKYCIAVENGIDEIKKLAFATTDSVENDGVVNYLYKHEK